MTDIQKILKKLAKRRGEKPEDWGARLRSAKEIAEWMEHHGWTISLGTVQHWIDGHQEPNPAAQVLLNLMEKELTAKRRK